MYLPSDGKKSSSHRRSSLFRCPVFFLYSRAVSTRYSSASFSISAMLCVCFAVNVVSPYARKVSMPPSEFSKRIHCSSSLLISEA